MAQFQRTINPAFRSSSPQPSMFESHHDPQSELAMRMGHQDTPPSRETTLTPQKSQPQSQQIDYRRQAQTQAMHGMEGLATVPHNEYPTDGMTMFCRTAPPSERSSVVSPVRPSSRDSQSEYSNPTSFSSQEPSGIQSPIKNASPSKEVQKKRSGFFSNSPFRRKSKHERDQAIPVLAPPKSSTWGPSTETNSSPRYARGNSANSRDKYSGSPEPVDPRANFQLNVGPNVFDVASPDSNRNKPTPNPLSSPTKELDPIAQALAELKGINKQSSVRMSADRYHGIATPGPPGTPGTPSTPIAARQNNVAAAQRGTPPPSYHDQTPIKRLDLPKPAFTSAQMKQTTRKYVGQTHDIYGSRPGTSNASEVPRATSPLPIRSVSPRPGYNSTGSGQGYGRSVSPNPSSVGRPRQSQSSSPTKPSYGAGNYSRIQTERTISPLPQFTRQERPSSSGAMALQLSDGGNVSQRGDNVVSQRRGNARPMTYHEGQHGERARSKSAADGRKYTQDGRPILHFGKSL